ncbi:MAG: M15 family metallopeptidase [Chitinispirillales bacterium]|jgi:peptidoglycan L-alanyl-D-glutamate endopeptidase CwlK|nr:M15 family metallopeptidase [Chitinispirillales bacterium]
MSKEILINVIDPALAELAEGGVRVTDAARGMLYAAGLQESNLTARFQAMPASSAVRKGEGRGLWQMRVDDVNRVLVGGSTRARAETAANGYAGSVNPHAVWATLEYDDILAAIFARLMLWPDPAALPEPTGANERGAWDYYVRCWRPAPPRQQDWTANWRAAVEAVGGQAAPSTPSPTAPVVNVAVSTSNGRRGLSVLHPQIRGKAERLMELCRENGLPILITETLRTKAEQDALFAQGRTAPGNIVTNAEYPRSAHCWGVAFDFCRNVRGREFDNGDRFFDSVGALGKSVGLFWGGDFKSFKDLPHFEDTEFMVNNSVNTLISRWGTPEKFMAGWTV